MTAQAVHVRIELNPEVLAAVVAELELKNAPTFRLHSTGKLKTKDGFGNYRGLYEPAKNHVTIANGFDAYARERQTELVKHLSFTVLHELRHAWQRENWDADTKQAMAAGPYAIRGEELDANAWAEYAQPKYRGLVTVTRRPVGGVSRFAKFSQRHERKV